MEFGILGPLQAYAGGGQALALEPRPARILAVLLLSANQVVSGEYLINAVWDGDPPATAKRQLQNSISVLRRQLAAGDTGRSSLITVDAAGYRIRVEQGQLDAQRFQELIDEAQAMISRGQIGDAARKLRSALALWRGPALTGMTGRAIQAVAARLDEQRLSTREQCLDLELRLRRHQELIGELTELVAAHPARERPVVQLMLALYRSGRQADALRAYHQLRERLADELGLDPSREIQQLHTAILRNDPALLETTPAAVTATEVPRQLPAPPQLFTGRTAELADLHHAADASTVVITAIDGMAGIGKTALAVHAAHQLADRFPDGQVFLDLHGYTQGITPVEPGEALDRLLRTLGVAGEQIPADLDQRAGLYRSRLADKRMLIVLDNAATETQVLPLLPGAAGCLVMVTSRRRLVSMDKTRTVSLDTLPPTDAVTLFTRLIGEQRLAGQALETVAELVELCGRLPLAVRIVAGWLGSHRAWRVADLVALLGDQDRRLVELDDGARSVAAALELSYQQLPADQRHLYRLLGLHPGPDIDSFAAAALADTSIARARRLLDRLLDAHLLQEPARGRYVFHDLVRAHAARTAGGEPGAPAALGRLLDYYRHTAAVAVDVAYPYEREHRPRVPPAYTPTPELPDSASALAWLDTELPNLLAVVWHAAEAGRAEPTWHLSVILRRHLRTRGRYQDAHTLHHQALVTARASGHRGGEVAALNGLGRVHLWRGQRKQAADQFERALRIARTIADRAGELDALDGLGRVHQSQGGFEQAADHFGRALEIARAIDHRAGELDAWGGLGIVRWLQSRFEQAADHFERALEIARAIDHRTGELDALGGLGIVRWLQGRSEQAADHFGRALHIAQGIGSRVGELYARNGLGHVYRMQGSYGPAAHEYEQALRIARTIGDRDGELSALSGLGHVHRAQRRYEQATGNYQQLLDLAQDSGHRIGQFEAMQGLGRLQYATGHPDAAIAHHSDALGLADELGQPDAQARAHDGLAHAHHALGRHEQAHRHWRHALGILTVLGVDRTDDEETTVAAIRAHLTGPDQQHDGRAVVDHRAPYPSPQGRGQALQRGRCLDEDRTNNAG